LRDVFRFISLEDLPIQVECIIDDISEVLSVTDVKKILRTFFHEGKGKDPIVHFYETFLAQYDPATREKRGVYYTPEHVVSYIVRSLHHILKEEFNRSDGFATESVTVLDPAAGTLTFPAEAARLAVNEYVGKYGEGGREGFIKDYILENFYAFELMMSPYAVGHLKISFLLEELGYTLRKEDRAKLYLTNTLEMEDLVQTKLPGMSSLSEESHLAGKVKKEQPILVILGNPPYSGHSANKGKWIDDLLKQGYKRAEGGDDEGYYKVDGRSLKEKNPKWLQDDYVKFIRFAQWKIDQAGEGILGFITNHSYLDNPTFRGMRRSLMNSFNEIYILDLHGNSLKKEKCPDGSKDQNVFDIRQGVAIAIFIKKRGKRKDCNVYHSDLWGLRDDKYVWLQKNDLKTTKWKKISPKSESYFFIPRDENLLEKYQEFPKITEIFPVNSVGIVTARDNLTIKWTSDEVRNTIQAFAKMDKELARIAYSLGEDARDWKVELAQKDLMDSGLEKNRIVPILYRPFDVRYTYYTGKSRGFHCMPRPEVMRHMLQENLGLLVHKREELMIPYSHFLVSNHLVEHGCLSSKTTCYLAPLFVYPDLEKNSLFKHEKRQPNIQFNFFKILSSSFNKELKAEDIFYYIYAVVYSTIYRNKYAELLRSDFPRIPFSKDYGLFNRMAKLGERLVRLHLLQSQELDSSLVKSQGKGDNVVEKLKYDVKDHRVYYNPTQYFEGVTGEIWEYQIGGYQVCNKWLKDRKGKRLSAGDMKHYCRICNALQKTIEIQKEIDAIYPEVEKEIIKF
jgi:predicted helicase